jgi:2-polyprenyl-3-methyl-5-hydroxy-6-metoxy-1,4-benzoquinol methylase
MTISYYDDQADAFIKDTLNVDMSHIMNHFLAQVPGGGTILDAGCGTGRDTKIFRELGYNVSAFDPSQRMVDFASNHAGITVRTLAFQELEDVGQYDGIWCCASLLHVPYVELSQVLLGLRRALREDGTIYMSFKHGAGERLSQGRHFTDMTEQGLRDLLNNTGVLQPIELWTTPDARPGRSAEAWLNALVKPC